VGLLSGRWLLSLPQLQNQLLSLLILLLDVLLQLLNLLLNLLLRRERWRRVAIRQFAGDTVDQGAFRLREGRTPSEAASAFAWLAIHQRSVRAEAVEVQTTRTAGRTIGRGFGFKD